MQWNTYSIWENVLPAKGPSTPEIYTAMWWLDFNLLLLSYNPSHLHNAAHCVRAMHIKNTDDVTLTKGIGRSCEQSWCQHSWLGLNLHTLLDAVYRGRIHLGAVLRGCKRNTGQHTDTAIGWCLRIKRQYTRNHGTCSPKDWDLRNAQGVLPSWKLAESLRGRTQENISTLKKKTLGPIKENTTTLATSFKEHGYTEGLILQYEWWHFGVYV